MARYDYTVTVQNTNGKYRLAWVINYETSPSHYERGSYLVSPSTLNQSSKAARKALQDLIFALRDGKMDDYPRLLRALAAEGYNLYQNFFFPLGGQFPEYDKEAMENELVACPTTTITFRSEAGIQIPWGLAYDQEVSNNDSREIDPANFWCLKYDVGTHDLKCRADGVEQVWDQDRFPLLLAAHKTIWEKEYDVKKAEDDVKGAEDDVKGAEDEEWRKKLKIVLKDERPKFSTADLDNAWKERDTNYGLLAFFCHGTGTTLDLGGGQQIRSDQFKNKFARNWKARNTDTPPTLVFLGACDTAVVNELDAGFLAATSERGFCGYIGTEVQVPTRLTLEFVADFLHELYEVGGPVYKIMKEVRGRHRLLGLAFSMYCARALRLSERLPASSSASGQSASPD